MDSICFFGERLKSFIILNINEIVGGGGLGMISLSSILSISQTEYMFSFLNTAEEFIDW